MRKALFLLLTFLIIQSGYGSDVKAGFAKINITPTEAMAFHGWGGRHAQKPDEPRRFITDLFIRATAIQDAAGRKIILLSYDTCGVHPPMFIDIPEWAREKHGVEPGAVLLNATHTHAGPRWWRIEDPADFRYYQRIERETKNAIDRAIADLQPVKIRFGIMKEPTFMANRAFYDERKKKYLFATFPAGSVDPDVPVFAFYRDDKLVSLLYSFAAHTSSGLYIGENQKVKKPVSDGGEILGSADFPAFIARELKAEYGDDVMVSFYQGAAGDMSYRGTRDMEYDPDSYRPWRFAESLDGTEKIIAGKIADFLNSDKMSDVSDINFKSARGVFNIPYDCEPDKLPPLEHWLELAEKAPDPSNAKTAYEIMYPLYYDEDGKLLGHAWIIALIEINENLQIVAASGEVCHGLSLAVKEAYPDINTVFFGYTHHASAYIPDDGLVGTGCYQEIQNQGMPFHKEEYRAEYKEKTGRTRPLFKKGVNKVLLDAVEQLREEAEK